MGYKTTKANAIKRNIYFCFLLNLIMSCGSRATLNKPSRLADSVTIGTVDPVLDTAIDQNTTTYKSLVGQRFSYEFENVPFFKVYDSLHRQWGLSGGYSSILRECESLLQPVNLSVSKATPSDILRILFKSQPLLTYSYDVDKNSLIISTDSAEAFLNENDRLLKRKFKQ